MTEVVELHAMLSAKEKHQYIFVDQFDEDVWLSVQVEQAKINTILTREQAQELIEALQRVVQS